MKQFIGKYWKPVVETVAFILIFAFLLVNIQNIFEPKKECYGKYSNYNEEEEDSLDIIYFGNSRVNRGINPTVVDGITGYRSYNYGIQGLRANHVYFRVKDALTTQTPKLVVIDAAMYLPSKESLEEAYIHRTLISLPFSLFKVESALELGVDEDMKKELIFPLLRFHSRYREIESTDFIYMMDINPDYPYANQVSEETMMANRGYMPYPTEKKIKDDGKNYFGKDYSAITEIAEPDKATDDYFQKMVTEAKNEGAQVLIISIPSLEKAGNAKKTVPIMNYLRKIYENDDSVKFLDFSLCLKEVGLSYENFHNEGHLNRTGAQKLSEYLGNFIKENYSLK